MEKQTLLPNPKRTTVKRNKKFNDVEKEILQRVFEMTDKFRK